MSPYLPVEIIRAILLLALPPPGFNTWSARAQTLRSCSLVNSSWRIVAQDVLFRNPVIQDSLDKCKVALKKGKWGEVNGKRNVRLIRIDMSLKEMEQLWEQWSGQGSVEVTIFHCSDVCMERLAKIVGLEFLHIACSSLEEPPTPWARPLLDFDIPFLRRRKPIPARVIPPSFGFPHLRNLALIRCRFSAHEKKLVLALTPSNSPRLEAVCLRQVQVEAIEEDLAARFYHNMGSQLRAVSLECIWSGWETQGLDLYSWKSMKSLQYLHFIFAHLSRQDTLTGTLDALSRIPLKLRYIQIPYFPDVTTHPFTNDLPSTSQLERIFVDCSAGVGPLAYMEEKVNRMQRGWDRKGNSLQGEKVKLKWIRGTLDAEGPDRYYNEGFWEAVAICQKKGWDSEISGV